MLNPICFSDYIKPATRKITFGFIVLGRFVKMLFSRNKQLILLELDYNKRYQFDNSLLVIRFHFKNALWYNFHSIRQTTNAGVIVLNMQLIKTPSVTLTVHGFFHKRTFQIELKPEASLQDSSFNTAIQQHNLQCNLKPITVVRRLLIPKISTIQIHNPSTLKPSNSFQMNHPSFNQTQFV